MQFVAISLIEQAAELLASALSLTLSGPLQVVFNALADSVVTPVTDFSTRQGFHGVAAFLSLELLWV
jgi:hypothetical protein